MDEGVRIPVLERMKQLYLEVVLGLMRQTYLENWEKTITGQKAE